MDIFPPKFVSSFCTPVWSIAELIETHDACLCTRRTRTATIKEWLGISSNTNRYNYGYLTAAGLKEANEIVTIPESYLATLTDVTLVPDYNLLIKNNRFVIADRFGTKQLFDANMAAHGRYFNYNLTLKQFIFPGENKHLNSVWDSPTVEIDDTENYYLLSCDRNDQVYAHWIWKILYEIYFAIKFLENHHPILIFTYEPRQWQIQSLLHYFPSLSNCRYGTARCRTRFKRIFSSIVPSDSVFLDGSYHSHLRGSFCPTITSSKRIYISRSDARTRRIVNEKLLVTKLQELGYQSIVIGDMPTIEQAKIFASASHLIYTNGSHFTNLIYCKPGTKVCVITGIGFDPIDFQIIRNFGVESVLFSTALAPNLNSVSAHDADLEIDTSDFFEFLCFNEFCSGLKK
jgi:hypothetical protein